MFDVVPDLTYVGVDISQSSLDYAQSALVRAGIDPSRLSMVHADAMTGDLVTLGEPDGFDAIVCCEVLEHVDEPDTMLAALHAALPAGKTGFFSTVANMEAEDHVYLYNDVDEIRAMLAASGWTIVRDQPMVLPGAESWDPLPVNYSVVVAS
jgi:2-polyprenyl-3-methyl-5-hydroxy-6-metoxy-1,4-benzoquinol methylase